ncbi:unnamed protein product, partial [Prorocentrum cordatum]
SLLLLLLLVLLFLLLLLPLLLLLLLPSRFPGPTARFGRGSLSRRALDWFDWMLPEAWSVYHNQVHHYRVNERADPDLFEDYVSTWKLPKEFMTILSMLVFKWAFAAPNSYKDLKLTEMRKSGRLPPRGFDPGMTMTIYQVYRLERDGQGISETPRGSPALPAAEGPAEAPGPLPFRSGRSDSISAPASPLRFDADFREPGRGERGRGQACDGSKAGGLRASPSGLGGIAQLGRDAGSCASPRACRGCPDRPGRPRDGPKTDEAQGEGPASARRCCASWRRRFDSMHAPVRAGFPMRGCLSLGAGPRRWPA